VFGLEGVDLETLNGVSPRLAQAEAYRRASRAALHAVSELLALEDPCAALSAQPSFVAPEGRSGESKDRWVRSLTTAARADTRWQGALDRFISVVNYADANGCLYLNATFVPTEPHEDLDVTERSFTRGPIVVETMDDHQALERENEWED
jgi:hypothetical protein